MAGNSNLHDSARNKQDEFYTQLSLIEKEAMKIALKKVRGMDIELLLKESGHRELIPAWGRLLLI